VECRQNQLELLIIIRREAEINADTFSQNESASQSEDPRAGKYTTESLGDEPRFAQNELSFTFDSTKQLFMLNQSNCFDRQQPFSLQTVINLKAGKGQCWYFATRALSSTRA
jgi:hypothetical protein